MTSTDDVYQDNDIMTSDNSHVIINKYLYAQNVIYAKQCISSLRKAQDEIRLWESCTHSYKLNFEAWSPFTRYVVAKKCT